MSCHHRSERHLKSCESTLPMLSLLHALVLDKAQSRQYLILFTQMQLPVQTTPHCFLDFSALGNTKDLCTVSVLLGFLLKANSGKLHLLCFRISAAGTPLSVVSAQKWLLSIFLGYEDTSRASVPKMASLQKESMMEDNGFIILFLFPQQTVVVLKNHILFLIFPSYSS